MNKKVKECEEDVRMLEELIEQEVRVDVVWD